MWFSYTDWVVIKTAAVCHGPKTIQWGKNESNMSLMDAKYLEGCKHGGCQWRLVEVRRKENHLFSI